MSLSCLSDVKQLSFSCPSAGSQLSIRSLVPAFSISSSSDSCPIQAPFLSFSLSILLSGVSNLSLSYVSAMESNMDGDVDINVDSAMHYNVDWPIRGSSKSTGYD